MEYNTIHCSRPQTVPYLQLPPPRRGTYTLELSINKVSLALVVLCPQAMHAADLLQSSCVAHSTSPLSMQVL